MLVILLLLGDKICVVRSRMVMTSACGLWVIAREMDASLKLWYMCVGAFVELH